ncbi:MAG: hypothetical protein IJ501_02380 [Bacilli bacterium]|nr:hypothetical protein [Bacilli bacterium]
MSLNVLAGSNIKARIGNNFYETLEEAIAAASSTDVITLTGDVSLSETMEIKKTVNINLNNHTISADSKVFLVEGGSLNLTGNGKIKENKPYYGAIVMKGSSDPNDEDYSTISVSEGVTLEGWSGIFIDHNDTNTAHGILVNMNGDINAVNDIEGGPGAGIYVNGNIKHDDNPPVINLSDTVEITSTGNGIYAAGYAIYNINGATIEGDESGLGIKSGVFNVNSGNILSNGADETPTTGNNNGINASGTAIQIESNPGYFGKIELDIDDGNITSSNSYAIYEYTTSTSGTNVSDINLKGGTYSSKKDNFNLSESFKGNHPTFISGGSYTSDPTPYLITGYGSSKDGDVYEVISSTMSVFGETNGEYSNFPWGLVIGIISLVIVSLIGFINRDKIFNFLSNIRNR